MDVRSKLPASGKKPPIALRKAQEKESLKKQLKLVRNKEVRAVPGGYYTGLVNDMHKDYENFQEKGTFLQMEYLNSLLDQTRQASQSIDRFNEETRLEERKLEKSQAFITLNPRAIQCNLPFDYSQLENLSPLAFLTKYTRPLPARQSIVRKLIRKTQRDANTIDIDDAKDILFEYCNFNHPREHIDELFRFLEIHSMTTFQSNEILVICCYAERYFLERFDRHEKTTSDRSLQEMIDLEFFKRKLDGVVLTEGLARLIKTFGAPATRFYETINR